MIPATSGPPTKALAALQAGKISLANSSCMIESSLSLRQLAMRWFRLWIALCASPCLQASVFVSKSTWRCSVLMTFTVSIGWKEVSIKITLEDAKQQESNSPPAVSPSGPPRARYCGGLRTSQSAFRVLVLGSLQLQLTVRISLAFVLTIFAGPAFVSKKKKPNGGGR